LPFDSLRISAVNFAVSLVPSVKVDMSVSWCSGGDGGAELKRRWSVDAKSCFM